MTNPGDYETKAVPHFGQGITPAAVPFKDTTSLDREAVDKRETEKDEETTSTNDASEKATPTGDTSAKTTQARRAAKPTTES